MNTKETVARFEKNCYANGINPVNVLSVMADLIENSGQNTGLDILIIANRYNCEIEHKSESEENTLMHLSILAESMRIESNN